jgi:Putative Flp pilus-assembly TadE/G-like
MPVNRRRTWRSPDDRGAVATVFALLLGGGVLLGVMALVVDVGQIYVERSELQSGADAAALGVARACATDAPECDSPSDLSALVDIAQRYANANAADGVSKVAEVCGRLPDVLPECGDAPTNLTACLGLPPPDALYVEVRLSTELPGDRFALPPAFAQSVMQDFDGVSVGACARATWQARIDVPLLGIAMSTCDFDGTAIGGSVVLGTASDCDDMLQGAVIDDPDPRCEITVPGDALLGGHALTDLLIPVGGECKRRMHEAISDGTKVYLPVYDSLDPPFRVVGAAGVVITGYVDSTNSDPPPDVNPPPPDGARCEGLPNRCISMRLVEKIGPFSNVGNSTVDLIG